ncbi:MAG: class I SAM-dependent methyltransferase [Anaerolineales bacterium]|nr:class I SAM-dependent methyltransferase [Anaerolineales bacterium]
MVSQTPLRYFDHAERARRYERTRPQVHGLALRDLWQQRGQRPIQQALDIGCGTGHSLAALSDLATRCLGCDLSAAMLAAAPHGLRVQLLLAAAEQLPLASGSLDLVTATMVWHWLDQARAGAEMARLLRPGGEIWILNFWFPGELPGEPTFAAWHRDVYHGRLPSPPRRRHSLAETLAAQPRLQPAASYDFSFTVPFSAKTLGDYLTTQSNIEAALRTGASLNEIDDWLAAQLAPFFAAEPERAFVYLGRAEVAVAQ